MFILNKCWCLSGELLGDGTDEDKKGAVLGKVEWLFEKWVAGVKVFLRLCFEFWKLKNWQPERQTDRHPERQIEWEPDWQPDSQTD